MLLEWLIRFLRCLYGAPATPASEEYQDIDDRLTHVEHTQQEIDARLTLIERQADPRGIRGNRDVP